MLFTTLSFFLFFGAVYAVYWTLRDRARIYFLIFASIVFYAAWSAAFAVHFFLITALNYYLIQLMNKNKNKTIFTFILIIDAANLFFFKYFYLFLETLYLASGGETLFQRKIFDGWLFQNFSLPEITLPLAISFYTFQLIAFASDTYRGKIEEKIPFSKFILFIMFFPQLVAGPIMRHSDFFPQLEKWIPDRKKTTAGMFLLMQGLLKKTVFADNMQPLYQDIYSHPEKYDWISNLAAPAAFAVHVYCDFSGYTDIARGLGNLLGIDLPENFRGPYLARSQQELWRRWHITLS
ncbi:MAG: MBOAT family protein, partial [Spirochaetia bacterium]|nr:MBOAT family protein [Spirochaetia bacterium]